jgi:hypothetical protein
MSQIYQALLAIRSRSFLGVAVLLVGTSPAWCQSLSDEISPSGPGSVTGAPTGSVIPAIEPALPIFTSTAAMLEETLEPWIPEIADSVVQVPTLEKIATSDSPAKSDAAAIASDGIPAQGTKRSNNPFLDARSAKLPKLPSLAEMTGPNTVDANWLKKSEVFSSYTKDSQFGPPLEGMRAADLAAGSMSQSTDPSLLEDGNGCLAATQGIVFTWAAPNFYTRPLYFEQVNFERYDTKVYPWARPVVSYAAFLGTIPILPYKMGGARVHEKVYTLGHWRPGDPTPHQIHWWPKTWRGAVYQGAATTGLIFFLP